jgi:hypothetical protein
LPLDTIDEMLLIHGYNRRVMFGTPEFPGLQAYLTVFGGLDKTDAMKSKINVNTATEPVLLAVLGQQYAYHVDSILSAQRNSQPFENDDDLRRRLGLVGGGGGSGGRPRGGRGSSGGSGGSTSGGGLMSKLKTSSDVFSIDCLVEINDYSKRYRCVIKRKEHQSKILFKTLMWKEQV